MRPDDVTSHVIVRKALLAKRTFFHIQESVTNWVVIKSYLKCLPHLMHRPSERRDSTSLHKVPSEVTYIESGGCLSLLQRNKVFQTCCCS